MTSVFINQCRRDTRTCCLPGVVKLKQTAAKASDSLPLSVRHLFLRPADKEQKNEIDFLLTCFQLHTQESGIGRACRPRKEYEGQFFTSYRCLEQECAVTLGNRRPRISQCHGGWLLLLEVSARKDLRADSPLDVKTPNDWRALKREQSIQTWQLLHNVSPVWIICYITLCKTSCCINILWLFCDALLLLSSLMYPTKLPLPFFPHFMRSSQTLHTKLGGHSLAGGVPALSLTASPLPTISLQTFSVRPQRRPT